MSTKLVSLREVAKECLKDWDFDVLYQTTIEHKGDDTLFIEEISNSSAGFYQADDIINVFHLEDFVSNGGDEWEALDEKWEVIEEFTTALSELITQVMQEKYDIGGIYYFSSNDCGDYGLFYREDGWGSYK